MERNSDRRTRTEGIARMDRLNILIDNPLIWGGGCETLLQSMVEYFMKDYDFTVLTDPAEPEKFPAAADPAVRWLQRRQGWIPLPRYTLRWFANRISLRAADILFAASLSVPNFDIAIAMAEGPGMRFIGNVRAKRRFGWIQKDFRMLHTSRQQFRSDRQELDYMRRYERIVCVSEAARQGVLETVGDPGNLCVRYNPINTDKIRKLSLEACEADHPAGRPLVITVGRLHGIKNIPMLLRACGALEKRFPFDLWIIGEGPERERIEQIIAEEKLSFVRLFGSRLNPYPYMRMADLYVSASASESYGLSIQESFILGVPAVAVRNPGVEEGFDDRFGILTGNSEEELQAGLERMLSDPALMQGCRRNIAEYYPAEELYEKRFEAIRSLWVPDRTSVEK